MRVLLFKTSSMGDIVLTLPAITDAVRYIPDIRFDWIVEENFSEIPHWHDAVETVIPVAIRRWRCNIFKAWYSGEWSAFTRQLAIKQYDCAIDAQSLIKSAFLTRYVNCPVHGLDYKSSRERWASFFYDKKHSVLPNQHAVERYRRLFAAALGYEYKAEKGDFGLNNTLLAQHEKVVGLLEPIKEPFFVFVHGSARDKKLWIESYWGALADILNKRNYFVYLPWGNVAEFERAKRIAAGRENVIILPKASLGTLARLMRDAAGVVSVDSGLGHVAAAIGARLVSLYSVTNPYLIGTYGERSLHLMVDHTEKISVNQHEVFKKMTPAYVWTEFCSFFNEPS